MVVVIWYRNVKQFQPSLLIILGFILGTQPGFHFHDPKSQSYFETKNLQAEFYRLFKNIIVNPANHMLFRLFVWQVWDIFLFGCTLLFASPWHEAGQRLGGRAVGGHRSKGISSQGATRNGWDLHRLEVSETDEFFEKPWGGRFVRKVWRTCRVPCKFFRKRIKLKFTEKWRFFSIDLCCCFSRWYVSTWSVCIFGILFPDVCHELKRIWST